MAEKIDTIFNSICVHCKTRLNIVSSPPDLVDNEIVSSQIKRQKLEIEEEPDSQICTICLDILNPKFVQSIATSIIETFSKENYDTTSFCISTIIPFSIWIREYLTSLFTGNTFLFEDRKTALKRQLKKTYARAILECSNLRYDVNSSLEIIVEITHAEADKQVSYLASLLFPLDEQRRRKRCRSSGVTFATVERILSYNELSKFRELNAFPLTQVDTYCELNKVSFENAPLYVAGRYNKYSRIVSQTPWSLDGEKVKFDSVEKIISLPVMRMFSPSVVKFTAAGREDIDVKMLGTGRPFLLELGNPRKSSNIMDKCRQIESELKTNERVNVSLMTAAAKSHTALIKQGEARNKTYRALLFSKIEFTQEHVQILVNTKDLKLEQKTPIRVLHRRAPATRDKAVYSMTVERRDAWHLDLYLTTQSGTYIKEFVHGDLGRTQPSLRTILALPDLDIVELDVLNVALDWPVNV